MGVATAFTHGFAGGLLALAAPRDVARGRLACLLALVAAAPDLDVVGFWLDIPYEHPLGHRGFSHSIAFALLVAALLPCWLHPELRARKRERWHVSALYAVACASHGVLDAFTNGGLGIGFLIPISDARFFAPFRPVMTSSLDPRVAFGAYGMRVLQSELLWLWLPCSGIALVSLLLGRLGRARAARLSRGSPSPRE
jgi:inner membrane protein